MEVNDSSVVTTMMSDPLRILHGTAVILDGVLGIAGNLLVIVSIATTPQLRTSHNAFLLNLSVTDLLLSAVHALFYSAGVLAGKWPLGQAVCRYSIQFSFLLWHVSLLTLAAIATNRYWLIAKPALVYNRFCGGKQIASVLLFIWLQSVGLFVITEFVIKVDIRYQPYMSTCALNPWDPISHRYITAIICIVVFTVMVVIPVQYARVFLAVRASRNRLRTAVIPRPTSAVQVSPGRRRSLEPVTCVTKDEMRIIYMSVLLTFVCILSYIPLSIVYIFGVSNPVLFKAGRFAVFILSIAPTINPFIYAWMNRNIQKACFRIIRCRRLFPRPRAVMQLP